MPFAPAELWLRRYDDQWFETTRPLVYQGRVDSWRVPAGTKTDFASVPRVAVWLIPKFGKYTLAAVLHDWFCSFAIRKRLISARDADGVFRRVLRELEVPFLLRWLVWAGVRWGAVANPIRRPGWSRDLPRLIPLTLLALPILLLAVIGIGVGLGLYTVLEFAFSLIVRGESPEDVGHKT